LNGSGKTIDGKVAGSGWVNEDGYGGSFDGFRMVGRWHTIVPEKSRFSVWFSVFSTETETETD
jgi:hypothetical protein